MFSSVDHLNLLKLIQGVEITLTRSGQPALTMIAVKGRSSGSMVGSDGTMTDFNTSDWLIEAADCRAITAPQRGDVVTWNGVTFTVGHPDANQSAVNFFGSDELCLRVHSMRDA